MKNQKENWIKKAAFVGLYLAFVLIIGSLGIGTLHYAGVHFSIPTVIATITLVWITAFMGMAVWNSINPERRLSPYHKAFVVFVVVFIASTAIGFLDVWYELQSKDRQLGIGWVCAIFMVSAAAYFRLEHDKARGIR